MPLSSLHLRNFRNFAEQKLELPREGVAIIGDNGQGKTNLLEAIYYLEIFRSFRGSPDEQLVRFGEEVFRIEGRLSRSESEAEREEVRVAAAFQRRGKKKKITIDGGEPERLSDAIGRIGAVIFSPADVTIVAGSPALRRRFLDIVLSLCEPSYLTALQRYRQALLQRNVLLRQGAAREQVTAWDTGLIAAGARVIAARARWIREHEPGFSTHYAAIAEGSAATLAYEGSIGEWTDEEEIAPAFEAALERSAEREARRGITLVGPHRDDVRVLARPTPSDAFVDLRTYGSGGQQRTAAVALRILEAETIRSVRGKDPVILLDDVFAELDPGRSRRILEWIEQEERVQVILTAPKPADFDVRGGSLARWRIDAGVLHPL